ncbi:hypothetical protein LTR37_001512 [Vermiconidia calcicola]|uniref:Uncharacterized protein n=1 Tax=Vermiconidia calcicola TaxID=1690605 RepID=A0ACC3NVF3_9PEZI|nr:hypothetical protein LTR37_001512 [Vermiconidia calcicola]
MHNEAATSFPTTTITSAFRRTQNNYAPRERHQMPQSHLSRMHELDAKIKEVEADIDIKHGELDILYKEKELEKEREIARGYDVKIEEERREVKRLREARKKTEEEGRKRIKREADAAVDEAAKKRRKTELG